MNTYIDTTTYDATLAELDEMIAWLTVPALDDERGFTPPTFDITSIIYYPAFA